MDLVELSRLQFSVTALYHFIFVLNSTVDILQATQTVNIQSRKTASFHGTKATPRAFYPHYFYFFTGKRIFGHCLAGSITTAVVGQAQVSSQQVRAVNEQSHFIASQFGCLGFVPQITYMLKGFCFD